MYENIGTDEREIVIARFGSIVRKITASYESKAIYGEKRQEGHSAPNPLGLGYMN
ncbi:MAG: hypothetical protein GDA38_18950 [Hormoscilla sp. SP12CHS1]|nr:hypothetical protein [Hormoscilla sp. SP12CHS1]